MTSLLFALLGYVCGIASLVTYAILRNRDGGPSFKQHAELAIYCALIRTGADGGTGTMIDAVELADTFNSIVEKAVKDA